MDFRNRIIAEHMGKLVHVIVDRPIGYRHGDITYPINYGYIPGVVAGDGEEQDAYILGVSEPVAEYDGQVVAAIRRKNDCEDKLVVAPVGTVYHQGQIAEAVRFQEQYFVSTIDSLFRKSCGVIPFRRNGGGTEYLILLQTNNCWSFPKGHMEAGESEEETALRELQQTYDALAELMTAREKQGFCEADAAESAREAARLFRREVCLEAKDNSPERVAALKECCDTFESLIPLIQQKSERVKNLGFDAKHASRHLERMRGDYAAACKMLKK
jgi:hypothetical protein